MSALRWTLLGLWAVAAGVTLWLPTSGAHAGPQGKSRYEILKQRQEQEAAREQEWRKRYAKRVKAVEAAQQRLEEIEQNRTWTNRGVSREQEEKAQTELQRAQKAMDALYDEARREEVPPGWLRSYD